MSTDDAALYDTLLEKLDRTQAAWVLKVLGKARTVALALARRRLPALMAQNPGLSNRRLAAMLRRDDSIAKLGISHTTVATWKKESSGGVRETSTRE